MEGKTLACQGLQDTIGCTAPQNDHDVFKIQASCLASVIHKLARFPLMEVVLPEPNTT